MSGAEPRPPALTSPDAVPQTVSDKGAFHVPFEVLLRISEELPPPSRVALALSCKPIFAAHSDARAIRHLTREELVGDPRLLERDAPNDFLCFGCLRLRP